MKVSKPPAEIGSLTGVRFVAAMSIALAHIGVSYAVLGFELRNFAILGMPLFFTLSGFVIHYVYSDSLSSGGGVASFGIARLTRLWPLYVAFYIWFAINTPFGAVGASARHWPEMIAYLTLTFSWFPLLIDGTAPIQHYYGYSWSISTEVFFYIVYALGIYRVAQIRRVSTCLLALIIFCLATLLLMAALYLTRDVWEPALARATGMPTRQADWMSSFYRWFLYVSPYVRIFEFIGGCFTCQLYLLMRERSELLRLWRPGWLAFTGAAITVGIFIFYCWYVPFKGDWVVGTTETLGGFFITLHLNFLLAPGCYLLFLGLALGRSSLERALATRVAVWLGTISYSIYLGHVVAASVVHGRIGLRGGIGVAAGVALTIAMASATYLLIERPGQRWLRRQLLKLVQYRRSDPVAGAVKSL